jgi:prepilin-type N-terminal cleavage/methylation domain-containing protein
MSVRPISSGRERRGGFTLIEVMVAVGLTAVMLWGLLQLFTSATRFSSAVTNETEMAAAGRAALERMVREITAAQPPRTAYFTINNNADLDSIEFVAPTGADGSEMVHVKYHALSDGDGHLLARSSANIATSGSMTSAPGTYDDEASFGVRIEGLNIRHISQTGTISDSTWSDPASLPRAVLIELRLRDERGLARITLSSAATLVAGGI